VLAAAAGAAAQAPGHVLDETKINAAQGGFTGDVAPMDHFASAVAPVGDLDGDGIDELAVGVPDDDDGGAQRGAVWILFLDRTGAVREERKIAQTAGGGFPGQLGGQGRFGMALAPLGDLDGDGVADLAVGAPWTNDGGAQRGAVWILFLASDGEVREATRISDTKGGFTGVLKEIDRFGRALAPLGDLDGDGVMDLAVGAFRDHDGGHGKGAVWILFLCRDGTVKGHQKISDVAGGFDGVLADDELLGTSLAALGDLDGDGVVDLAAGAPGQQEVSMSPVHGGTLWVPHWTAATGYEIELWEGVGANYRGVVQHQVGRAEDRRRGRRVHGDPVAG